MFIHPCNLTFWPFDSIVLILKSTPIVVMYDGVKILSAKRVNIEDLPTPASPIISNLNKWSCCRFAILNMFFLRIEKGPIEFRSARLQSPIEKYNFVIWLMVMVSFPQALTLTIRDTELGEKAIRGKWNPLAVFMLVWGISILGEARKQ